MEQSILSLFSMTELEQILHAKTINAQDLRFTRVSTDSRRYVEGEIFLALKGELFDAHDFIQEVLKSGCRCMIVERVPLDLPAYVTVFVVEDGLKSFAYLAKATLEKRRELGPFTTYALTGSNGKTTTKEFLAALLQAKGHRVLKTEGNHNNYIGLPMTIMELSTAHDGCVLEMGANAHGEIAYLNAIVQPDIAIITGIGAAHLRGFGTLEGVARAKAEIMHSPSLKKIILPAKTRKYYENIIPEGLEQCWVGEGERIHIENIVSTVDGVKFRYVDESEAFAGEYKVELHLLGGHNAYNLAHAIAATQHEGWTEEQINRGIKSVVLPSGRLERWDAPNHVLFLHDAYNANPSSMKEAFSLMTQIAVSERRCFILGDMNELGDTSVEQHVNLGKRLGFLGMKCLLCVGKNGNYVREGAISAGINPSCILCSSSDELEHGLAWIERFFDEGDICLIKGSRSIKLERVLNYFKAQRH